MPELDEARIRQTLAAVHYPGFSRDIVSFGLVKEIAIAGRDVTVNLEVTTADDRVPRHLHDAVAAALGELPGVGRVTVNVHARTTREQSQLPPPEPIPGVRHVIAVASGKGGVGKSTVAANLAVALAQGGARVGLCDCDIYGPSIALMFGARERPQMNGREQILPVARHGLQLMSMGLLLEDASPAILRGPMVTRFTQQFLRQVAWGDLDYLVLDLPPGTGDIQLTVVQTVALAGAIIVTTPQEVALIDARKAAAMFAKVNVPVLGLIENMSYFVCPRDQTRYDIFGSGGGAKEARRLGVPLLGEIPIDIATREAGDRGRPIVAADPRQAVSLAFRQVADRLRATLAI